MNKRSMLEMIDDIFEVLEVNGGISRYGLQKQLGTNPVSVKNYLEVIRLIQSRPRVVFGKKKLRLGEDWVDPLVREVIGDEPNPNDLLYMKLLDIGATSPGKTLSLDELSSQEIQIIRKAKEMEHVIVTEDLRLYLSELGKTLAKGAKRAYL